MALSGLTLLLQVESLATGLLDAARGVFGLMLMAALVRGVAAARAHDMPRHRAWMIRAYVIGMGTGTVALIMFPIYLVTGEPPVGLASDMVVVGMWLINIALGEWVIRRIATMTVMRTVDPPGVEDDLKQDLARLPAGTGQHGRAGRRPQRAPVHSEGHG